MITRLAIAGAVTAGALATGVALGATDTVSLVAEGTVETGDDFAGLRPCPGLDPVAALTGGDRVFLTGRSDDGAWLQLRSPFDEDDRLWIDAALVTGDDSVEGLPVAGCGDVELAITLPDGSEVIVTPSTTTTTVPGETTTTTEPGETTTTGATVPGQTTTPPVATTQPPVATTAPPQTTTTTTTIPAPTIGTITRTPNSIIERWDVAPNTCAGPKTSTISAPVSGATTVTMSWNVGPQPRSKPMTIQGGTASANLGSFNETVAPNVNTTITVTITATGLGGQTTRQTTVLLEDCPFG